MRIERRHIATASKSDHMERRDAAERRAKAQFPFAERVELYAFMGDGWLAEVWDKGAGYGAIYEVAE
jgi:hypothetical protein